MSLSTGGSPGVLWPMVLLHMMEFLFCLGCVVWLTVFHLKKHKTAGYAVALPFLTLNALSNLLEGTFYAVQLSGNKNPSDGVAFLYSLGALCFYMGCFLLSLTFLELSRASGATVEARRKRTTIMWFIFAGFFVCWIIIDTVCTFVLSKYDSKKVDPFRIGGHCLFCGILLSWGWFRLRERLLEKEQLLTATAHLKGTIVGIRIVAVSAVAFLFVKFLVTVTVAAYDFHGSEVLQWFCEFSLVNVLPFCIVLLYFVTNVRGRHGPRKESSAVAPTVAVASSAQQK